MEQRAEELDKRRTENTRISSISLINNRNRKNNVEKAELAIAEEIKRKEREGVESNPFTRRKCNPRMVTKTGKPEMTSEMLRELAERAGRSEKENKVDAAAPAAPAEKRKEAEDTMDSATNGTAKKKFKGGLGDAVGDGKEDLFDAHNFDIEIDVGATLPGGPVAPSSVGLSSARPASIAPKDTGPAKRSLNLSDYKKKRGLI